MFQEIDQLAMMEPCTKWAARVYHPKRIPEMVDKAFRQSMSGKPGPVYLNLPGDVLYQGVDESQIVWPQPWDPDTHAHPRAAPAEVEHVIELLQAGESRDHRR